MRESLSDQHELCNGLPCRRLRLLNGDCLTVVLQGAQLVSWVSGGRERLYLSPKSEFDGQTPIRGGVPICFPQFNQRGPLPKHGFARNMAWRADDVTFLNEQEAYLTLRLSANEVTRAIWPASFELALNVHLKPGQLQITLTVSNTGSESLTFTGALHTYLAVNSLAAVQLTGLENQSEWNAVTNVHSIATSPLHFNGEFDRVYSAANQALILKDDLSVLRIEQSASFANTVVWNPAAEKTAALKDMPADGFRQMLCVEAAQVMQPVSVKAGAEWQGWQRLSVL
jgi:glucose-6-phosphate 1-epimerase